MKSNLRQMGIGLNPKPEQKTKGNLQPLCVPGSNRRHLRRFARRSKTKETCSPSAFPVRIDATCVDSQRKEQTLHSKSAPERNPNIVGLGEVNAAMMRPPLGSAKWARSRRGKPEQGAANRSEARLREGWALWAKPKEQAAQAKQPSLIMDRKIGRSRGSRFTTYTYGDEISTAMTNRIGKEHFMATGVLTLSCMKMSKRELSSKRKVSDGNQPSEVRELCSKRKASDRNQPSEVRELSSKKKVTKMGKQELSSKRKVSDENQPSKVRELSSKRKVTKMSKKKVGDENQHGELGDELEMSDSDRVRFIRDEDVKSEESLWNLYMRWRNYYKVPKKPDQIQKRFIIFKKRVHYFYERNQKERQVCDNADTCVLGLNQFSDMTFEEFARQYCGCRSFY
ncbi:KDEL-tailed cysteine endopeptidase CEP1 [Apostasia shenzhenica]|uniref:KDEL-tailed cysteine endopeptidase CEP1 n=1 Tax=Apostasia shenzhenica TaxID=1088818 RepID=A0A2I0A459_9ASPA|nr:KDEL-tailed cysteine endopeptidase CEP1 [Apostasia shenzhenica]